MLRYCRYREQLWYLNRHAHTYVTLDRLAQIDVYADELGVQIEKGDSLAHHAIARRTKLGLKYIK